MKNRTFSVMAGGHEQAAVELDQWLAQRRPAGAGRARPGVRKPFDVIWMA